MRNLTPEQRERKKLYDIKYNNTPERKAYMKEYRKNHKSSPEKSKEYQKRYNEKYPGRRNENARRFRHTEKGLKRQRESSRAFRKSEKGKKYRIGANMRYTKKRRTMAIEKLGGKCANPYNLNHGDFVNEPECLQIDHINGNGNEERKVMTSTMLYKKILRGETEGYQLLCANCNWIKRYRNKELKGINYKK